MLVERRQHRIDRTLATDELTNHHRDGEDGEVLENFPLKVSGRLLASPTLFKLAYDEPYLGIAVASSDGHFYIIHGKTLCTERLDFGERSNAMVLLDDLTGNGMLDFIISTDHHNVYCLSSEIPYHPLNTQYGRASCIAHNRCCSLCLGVDAPQAIL